MYTPSYVDGQLEVAQQKPQISEEGISAFKENLSSSGVIQTSCSQKHLAALTLGLAVWELLLVRILEHAPMLLWASLLVLAPVSGQLAAPKPVISLHPPWTVVFRGETVTLTCHVSHLRAGEYITWHLSYLGKDLLQKTPGNTLKNDWLILQAPHTVFEGDTLVLRCQVKRRQKLITVKYSWNGKVISVSNEGQDLLIPQASLNNSGHYQCIGFLEREHYVYKSSTRIIKIQELFPYPKLRVTPSQPTEGSSVNLSCQTQLPLERSDTLLYFTFFRDRGVMLSDWSRSPELQITTIWREDSGSYWCTAATAIPSIQKHSLPLQVHVQGVPVSGVLLETQPQGGQVLAGEPLVLVCSVAEGTGDIAFSWHREDTGEHLGRKQQRSQRAELEIPAVGGSHMGRYYCTADNGHGLARSGALNVTVTGTPGNRSGLIAAGATGGLLSILLLAVALWMYHQHQRKSGGRFLGNTARSTPTIGPGEAPHSGCPALVELQQLYGNGYLEEENLAYSEIRIIQMRQEEAASTSRTSLENKHTSVVYSAVKTQLPEDSAGEVRSQDEDAIENYENVQFA
ncbi:Fc receptor-like protein 4 [Vulpes lagopus]